MSEETFVDHLLSELFSAADVSPEVAELFAVVLGVHRVVKDERTYKNLSAVLSGMRQLVASPELSKTMLGQMTQNDEIYKSLVGHLEQCVRHPKRGAVLKAILSEKDGVERCLSCLHQTLTESAASAQRPPASFVKLLVDQSQDTADPTDHSWGFRAAVTQFSHLLALQRACVCVLRHALLSKSKKGAAADAQIERTTTLLLNRLDRQVEHFYSEWTAKWNASAGASTFSWDSGQLLKGVRAATSPDHEGREEEYMVFVARSSLYRLDVRNMVDGNAKVELLCASFPDLVGDYVGGPEAANALSGITSSGLGKGVAIYSWEGAELKRTDLVTREHKTVTTIGENPRGRVLKRQSLVGHQSGCLFFVTGTLYRLDASYLKQQHCSGFTSDGCQLCVDRHHVYVTDDEGTIWQVSADIGRPSPRKVKTGWHSGALVTSPIDSGYLYSLWDKTLYAIDKTTGEAVAVQSRRTWDHRITVMVSYGMSLYLFSDEGNVYRVRPLWAGPGSRHVQVKKLY